MRMQINVDSQVKWYADVSRLSAQTSSCMKNMFCQVVSAPQKVGNHRNQKVIADRPHPRNDQAFRKCQRCELRSFAKREYEILI